MRNKSSSKIVKALRALVVVTMLVVAFFIGTYVGRDAVKPQTVLVIETKTRYLTLEKPVVQYVDKPVVEYIERVEKAPVELRNFNDLDELKQWLGNKMDVTTIRLQSPASEVDCDDYAREMQCKALADGYIVSFEVIGVREYNALFKTKLSHSQPLHAINLAIIGNDIYYIEPQTGEVAFVVYLD
ncbi:hypothetical protein ACFLWC_07370 [Chloroflexota bacterium]